MTFRAYITESDRMDKKIEKYLDGLADIRTKERTSTAWYSPGTTYKIHSVDNGFYSKKPGIYTLIKKEQKFIPLKDLETENALQEKLDSVMKKFIGKTGAEITIKKNRSGDRIVYVNGETAYNQDDIHSFGSEEKILFALNRAYDAHKKEDNEF